MLFFGKKLRIPIYAVRIVFVTILHVPLVFSPEHFTGENTEGIIWLNLSRLGEHFFFAKEVKSVPTGMILDLALTSAVTITHVRKLHRNGVTELESQPVSTVINSKYAAKNRMNLGEYGPMN